MLLISIILAQIGIGWLFMRYLVERDRGDKEPWHGICLAILFGLAATGGAMFLEGKIIPEGIFTDGRATTLQLASASLGIGLIEEGLKLLPLALFIYKRKYFNEITDGLIYFGIVGMTFGIVENILYSLAYGGGAGLLRIVTVPFLHAGFCVLFGWLLARKKILKTSWLMVVAGFVLAVGFHALYDFGLLYRHGWSVITSLAITLGLNVGIFYLYGRAERTDIWLGLSTAHHNWYCPHCGTPNPKRFLYCPACGRKP